MKFLFFITLLIFSFSCGVKTAEGDFSAKITDLEIQLKRMENKSAEVEKNIEALSRRIDRVEESIGELRLEIERLRVQLERLTAGELKPEENVAKVEEREKVIREEEKEEVKEEIPDDPNALYSKALKLYEMKELYRARDMFVLFIKKFPEHKLTDNSLFWMGKIYQDLGDYKTSSEILEKLVNECNQGKLPDCNKLPDAYYLLMKAYMKLGDRERADKIFAELQRKFPHSEALIKAREYRLLED